MKTNKGSATCTFPDDGFNYIESGCDVGIRCYIGDGYCDYEEYASEACNYDGGDCIFCDLNSAENIFPSDDGFDYSNCNAINKCKVGDGTCDFLPGAQNAECNWEGGDCIFCDETSSFPSDGFDYSGCSAANKCWIGDGVCDDKLAYLGLNTPECNWEGGDCVFCPETSIFPRDGFDYSNCVTPNKCMIGDGFCSILSEFMFGLNTPECNWEAGDCDCYNAETPIFPNDGFDYSNCNVTNRCWLGDTECDSGDYNTSECNFDGGDCLCEQAGFPDDGFDYSNCAIENSCWIGDGFCDVFILGDDLSSFMNTTECNYDGGD